MCVTIYYLEWFVLIQQQQLLLQQMKMSKNVFLYEKVSSIADQLHEEELLKVVLVILIVVSALVKLDLCLRTAVRLPGTRRATSTGPC